MSDPLPPVRPLSPAVASTLGGKNNDAKLPAGALTRAMFADVVAQVDRKPEPEKEESAEAEAHEAPEEQQDSPPADEPGEEISTEEKSEEGGEPTEETNETEENVLSQFAPEVAEALKDLNADGQKHLVEIAQAIANGETTLGQVKRQLKLGRQENEELTQLRQRVQELESRPATATTGNLPPSVAKLKSVDEVEARQEQAEQSVRAIEDFLEENPQGGQIGDKEFTRAQLIERKRALQDELKALPKQAQALQATAQLSRAQAEVKAGVVKDFPYYADEANPDAKMARELITSTPAINQFPNRDYLALALARGHRELQAEKAARTGKAPVKKPGVQTPRSSVAPPGKPHSAGTASTKAPAAKPIGDLVKNVRNRESFADLLAETGR